MNSASSRSPSLTPPPPPARTLRITSYGYKNGPLTPSPMLSFDLRNLPNPPKHVRGSQSGLHKPLQDWLFSIGEVKTRIEAITEVIQAKLSQVEEEDAFRPPDGNNQLTVANDADEAEERLGDVDETPREVSVAVFCQLGKHRSVAVAEMLGKVGWNVRSEWVVEVDHRDLIRERTQAHKDRVRKKARDVKNTKRAGYESS